MVGPMKTVTKMGWKATCNRCGKRREAWAVEGHGATLCRPCAVSVSGGCHQQCFPPIHHALCGRTRAGIQTEGV